MKKLIAQFLAQSRIDSEILNRKLFDVNMRLFNNNLGYRTLISDITLYMEKIIHNKYDDYAELKGLSGANIGIPLNIIAIKVKDKKGFPAHLEPALSHTNLFFFLNPKIVKHSRKTTIVKSNCGSINLSEPVRVVRYDWIDLESYDLLGKKQLNRYGKPLSFTIQHEVDHSAGVLITDKIAKEV